MRTVRANGIEIAFEESGSGAPLLLLHGFVLDHSLWDLQVEALQRSYRIVVPDIRGLGKTKGTAAPVSIATMADDAAALLEALDIRSAAAAGFSMGGFILAQMAVRHPLKVRAAAFLCTRASADTPAAQRRRVESMRFIIDNGSAAFAKEFLPHLFSPAYAAAHPGGVEKIRRVVAAQQPQGLVAALDAMRQREDMTPRLGEIRVPCAVVGGALDALIPVRDMQDLHGGLPDSTYEMLDGVGHMAPMEAPERVTFALDQLMQRAGMWM